MSESNQGLGFHPLYQQIKELLIQRVLSGDWKPGEVLPSEAKLAAEYRVSQGTVRKAIEEMAADHLVIRHQGKGTFVSARGSESALHFFSIVTEDNRIASPGKAVHFAWTEGEANERESRDLRLAEDEPVYRIYRIRPVDNRPALIERIVVSSKRFPGLPELMRDAVRMNSYLIMEKHFGILVVRAEEWIEAVAADAEDAAQLDIAEGTPLLGVHRISYALDGTPAETRRMRFPTDRLRYRNTLR